VSDVRAALRTAGVTPTAADWRALRFEAAQYGELRVAPDGELLLTGLRGKDLKPL
jgi:hypothetical protein